MARAGEKVRGRCIGLVVVKQGASIQGGVREAIEGGEGRICSLASNEPEIVEFVTSLVNTVIEVDKKWGKNN